MKKLWRLLFSALESKLVRAIEYTAYKEMVLEKMNEIREEIFSKYSLTWLSVSQNKMGRNLFRPGLSGLSFP